MDRPESPISPSHPSLPPPPRPAAVPSHESDLPPANPDLQGLPVPAAYARLCPYCAADVSECMPEDPCPACGKSNKPAARQSAQNDMGPWSALRTGPNAEPTGTAELLSYDRLIEAVRAGVITASTPVRGPSTRQFWKAAIRTPGVAHLLGRCHNCQVSVDPGVDHCPACEADFAAPTTRQDLGLALLVPLPGEADAEAIAQAALAQPAASTEPPKQADRPTSPNGRTRISNTPNTDGRPDDPALARALDAPATPAQRRRIEELERSLWTVRLGAFVLLTLLAGAAVTIALLISLRPPNSIADQHLVEGNVGRTQETTPSIATAPPTSGEVGDVSPDRTSLPGVDEPTPGGTAATQQPTTPPDTPRTPPVLTSEGTSEESPTHREPMPVLDVGHAPLDPAAEPYREQIEGELARVRDALADNDGTTTSKLAGALTVLNRVRDEVTAADADASLLILDHHIVDIRTLLIARRLDALLDGAPATQAKP